ncbi:MAG: protein kinase [Planctomycetota bacterium]|nr:protein kinase [Planctomycetota bacterium]
MALEGQSLGDFHILHEIGRGGMGIVYLANQISLSRNVAVKVLPSGRALSADVIKRFRREASAASKLDHPLICAVYATGSHEGIPYIAMRYVEGKPLSKVLRERRRDASDRDGPGTNETFRFQFDASSHAAIDSGMDSASATIIDDHSLPFNEDARGEPHAGPGSGSSASLTATRDDINWAVALIEKAARALDHAHQARVIHRDIKPGNIMVTPDDDPVLLDFGLARSLEGGEDGPSLTQSGDIMGTPHYMSPEQLSGTGTLDARTDVYSLGVTLYELLIGRRPFEAPNRERLYRSILTEDPTPATAANPLIERDLSIVLDTAIERDLDRRYQTARAFANDLRAVLAHEPIAARPIGPILRSRKWLRRNPVVASTGLAAIVILVILLSESWFYSQRLERERNSAIEAKEDADRARAEAKVQANLARDERDRNAALVRDRDLALIRSKALRLAAEATARATTEPAVAIALARAAADIEATVETDQALRIALASSPEEILFRAPTFDSLTNGAQNQEPTAPRRRIGSTIERPREQVPVTGDVHWGAGLAVTLASAQGGLPIVWDLSDGKFRSVLGAHGGQVYTARFSNDGKQVVTASEDGTALVFDAISGKLLGAGDGSATGLRPQDRTFLASRIVEQAVFGPSDRFLLGIAGDVVTTWRRIGASGRFVRQSTQDLYRAVRTPPLAISHPQFPLIANVSSQRVVIWTPFTPKPTIIPSTGSLVTALAWSPATGSRQLAVGYASGEIGVFEISDLRTAPRAIWNAPISAHSETITKLAFGPQGQWLASGSTDRRAAVWNVATQQERWQPWLHGDSVRDLAWSSDGRLLATGSADNRARILDSATGDLRQTYAGHTDWVTRVAFDPEARRLFTISYDGSARIFHVGRSQTDALAVSLPREVSSVEWWPLDESTLIIGCRDGTIRVLDTNGDDARPAILLTDPDLRGARFMPDGQRFLAISTGRSWLRCGTLDGDTEWAVPRSGRADLSAGDARGLMATTFDGSLVLATGGGGLPRLVRTSDHKVIDELPQLTDPLRVVVVARPEHREFLVWSAKNAPVLYQPEGRRFRVCVAGPLRGTPLAASFSSDGRYLALTDSRHHILVYDLEVPDPVSLLPVLSPPRAVAAAPAWIPGVHSLAVAPVGGTMHIVAVDADSILQQLGLASDGIDRILVTPDASGIVTIIGDELVIWDIARNRRRVALSLGSANVEDWDLSPLGNRLALGLANGVVRIIPLNAAIEASGRRVRRLLAAEMERFDIGTAEERKSKREQEQSRLRSTEVAALRSRAEWNNSEQHYLAYARHILDESDPIPELYAQALNSVERAIRLAPRAAPRHLQLLARAQFRLGKPEQAIATIRQAMRLLPATSPKLAPLRKHLRRFEKASSGRS